MSNCRSTTYGIYVIQLDREGWFAELHDALGAELEAVGLQHSLTVQVSEEAFSPDIPSVAVYMGDARAAAVGEQNVTRLLDFDRRRKGASRVMRDGEINGGARTESRHRRNPEP